MKILIILTLLLTACSESNLNDSDNISSHKFNKEVINYYVLSQYKDSTDRQPQAIYFHDNDFLKERPINSTSE